MAESAPKDENPLYKFDNIERVWNGSVRRNRNRHSNTCRQYFSDFIRNHRSYQFSITRMFDGTTNIFVDLEMYNKMREELETKTETSLQLPDIFPLDMSNPSNVVERKMSFATQQQLIQFNSDLEKENDAVRARARKKASKHSKRLRQVLANQNPEAVFLAFDLEVFDRDRKTILEVGFVKFTLKEDDQPEYLHAVIEENLHLVNSNVSDNRDKFKFGSSKRMSLKEAAEILQKEISGADILVVHAGINDAKYLSDNGINVTKKTTFDTQILALDLLPSTNHRMITFGLKKILKDLGIFYNEDILHNAANDAHYTMMAFKALVKEAVPGRWY